MAFNIYMHERNIYKKQPDFAQIALDFPEFRKYIIPDAKGQKVRVNFANTNALRTLTKILLKKDFNLDVEIPEGFLIPTIPQRLNYILWLEDLLSNISQERDVICGIDIGTGPCAIFSLLGAKKNDWKFIATESSDDAILWAEKNISNNNLEEKITVVQVKEGSTLNEVLSINNESYDFCMCNPPFFESIEEIRNKHRNSSETIADVAQKEEIFVKGGELDFVKNILKDSLIYKDRIVLFTSMFGKKKSWLQIIKEVQEIKEAKFTTTEFCQGNTIRWAIAWTFNESVHFEKDVKKKIKPKKTKPPLEYQISLGKSKNANFDSVLKQTKDLLKTLQIPTTVTRASKNFTEFLLKSNTNTWSHQRRRRRELERQKKTAINLEEKHSPLSLNENNSVSHKDCESDENISSISADDHASENVHACCKRETMDKNCSGVKKTFNSENNQINKSPPENNESKISNNTNVLQSSKRKCDFVSEDLWVNKKTRLDEKISNHDTNDCLHAPSENTSLNFKDGHSMVNESIKTDTSALCVIDTKSAVLGNDGIDVSPNKSSEIKSTELKSQNFCQNDPSSSMCEDICSSSNERKCDPLSTTENSESSSVGIKTEPSEKTENDSSEQSLILDCHLQFIKGKSKIYVKMNCAPTADRNTMHQVFLLIKNKIN